MGYLHHTGLWVLPDAVPHHTAGQGESDAIFFQYCMFFVPRYCVRLRSTSHFLWQASRHCCACISPEKPRHHTKTQPSTFRILINGVKSFLTVAEGEWDELDWISGKNGGLDMDHFKSLSHHESEALYRPHAAMGSIVRSGFGHFSKHRTVLVQVSRKCYWGNTVGIRSPAHYTWRVSTGLCFSHDRAVIDSVIKEE